MDNFDINGIAQGSDSNENLFINNKDFILKEDLKEWISLYKYSTSDDTKLCKRIIEITIDDLIQRFNLKD